MDENGGLPCPYNQRRLPKELYVKLFVVYFTVISTFFHLMHLRRDYGISWVLGLYAVLCPIVPAVWLALPIILVSIQGLLYRDKRKMEEALLVTIGCWPKERTEHLEENWSLDRSWRSVRKALPHLAVLCQSCTTIWLFARRKTVEADSLYDSHVVQLAFLGLVTQVLAVVQIFLRPTFPESDWSDASFGTKWLAFYRPRWKAPARGNAMRTISSRFTSSIKTITRSGLGFIILLSSCGALSSGIEYHLTFKTFNGFSMIESVLSESYQGTIEVKYNLAIIYLICVVSLSFGLLESIKENIVILIGIAVGLPILYAMMIICIGISVFLVFDAPTYFVRSIMQVAELFLPALHRASLGAGDAVCPAPDEFNRIATFQAVSESCPCPQVLSDPAAGWVWALA